MDKIEEMSQGWWRPSPGSIYPLLSELEKDGYLKKLDDGRYTLTEKSTTEMESYPWFRGRKLSRLDDILNEMENYVSYMEDVSRTGKQKLDAYTVRLNSLKDRLASLTSTGGSSA